MQNQYSFHYMFYSDLLLSLRYFFNNIIFQTDLIKNFEFNTGSRTFQLNYKSQHELPTALINYQTTRAITYHPYVFQNTPNLNRIPVLFNRTKDLLLELQEELYEVTVDITINCESQLQALEMEQMIQHFSPPNKYFQHYRFYSFMKIDNAFVHPDIFDPNMDLIYNLFTKYNRRANSVDYCFAVEYKPMIKFESVQAQISSSDARSFAISCPLNIMTPVPVYQVIPEDQKPLKSKPIRLYNRSDIVVSTDEVDSLLLSFRDEEVICSVIPDTVTGAFTGEFIRDDTTYTITGIIDTEEIICDGVVTIANRQFNCSFNVVRNLLTAKDVIIVSGPLSGTLTNAHFSDTGISGFLKATVGNFEIADYIDVDELVVIRRSKILKNFQVESSLTQNVKVLSVKNIYNTNLDLSPRRMKLQTENSSITKLAVLKNNIQTIITLSTPIPISSTGIFNGSFTFGDSVTGVLMGNVNIQTGNLTYDVIFSEDDYILSVLFFNLQFKTGQYYGSRTIERQSINIGFKNELISTASDISLSKDLFNNVTMGQTKQGPGKLLRSTMIVPDDVTEVEDDKVLITITLDDLFDYSNYTNHFWRFIFRRQIYTSGDQDNIQFNQATEPYQLTFKAEKSWFYTQFNEFNIDNPIFFQFFKSY